MSFRKNFKVAYRTPRGSQEGQGYIVAIRETGRGVWFEVKDIGTGAIVCLRAANLSLVL
jgi:hypothetical protein